VASTPRHDGTRRGDVAWRLDAVSCGPDALLDGVTMGGAAGEICVVMGANGAGKTTLLRTLAGLTAPRSGTVWRRPGRVAYLPQNPAALLHRESVAAEVAWTARGLRDHGPEAQRAIMDVLDVTAIAERDPRDLSSGQRQRAAIAAVLSGRPDLVLLDEPTRGMDGAARAGLVAAARLLAGHGAAVVLATHDADLAADVADRVFLIAQDTLHDAGAPERALSGAGSPSTQLGRLFDSPGPVTVDAVASLYGPPVGARRVT
jgi:energy-coupling factor transport system ATP-binding protein